MEIRTADFLQSVEGDVLGERIGQLWQQHNAARQPWLEQKRELRNYLFATDTTTTTNSKLPWKNKTTLPKLTQIRDNLHANYMGALFPNDDWCKWEAYTADAAEKKKAQAIQTYMSNKTREGNFRTEVDKLVYDYIDYGNVFFDVEWVNEEFTDPETGEVSTGYVGPKLVRVAPESVVFDLTASSFNETWKIQRMLKSLGQLEQEVIERPELGYNMDILRKAKDLRIGLQQLAPEDWTKLVGYQMDGFSTSRDYFQSGYVEILEFEGSLYDNYTGEFIKDHVITVIDRLYVIRKERIKNWTGKSLKGHTGWRRRPDNIYHMGPLDNLVGMQYRIDHLENLKADAQDLGVHPPLAIAGSVEDFTWGPGEEIYIGEGGSITELGKNLSGVMSAENSMAVYEQKMEELAGAPRQAMGIRTPGEKTAFEVQTLDQASSRIFQNKVTNFEINVLEVALNHMLELARRNLNGSDVIRVMDDDIGVTDFITITKDDITAKGKIRPIGARHFATQAILMQNAATFFNSPMGQDPAVSVHLSGKALAKLAESHLGLSKYSIFSENIRVLENMETSQLAGQAQEDVMATDMTPTEAPSVEMPDA